MTDRSLDSGPMALSVTGAAKRYASGFTLSDVTFDLPAGYVMGLIGPNGAGKSTLIKLILNMIRSDVGTIESFGRDSVRDEETFKADLGVVFDSSFLLELWTIRQAERAVSVFYPAWDSALFSSYLDRFGLDPRKKIKELSRGMQMKLMLSMALSHDAHLLILDEPTSGLDVLARDELMEILREYVADGDRSVIFSTHITSDLEHIADFITYITGGRLYYSGPKDEFEDAFRIVRGGPCDLEGAIEASALGVRRFDTGFEALMRTETTGRLPAGLMVEIPGIDDIIRLTNGRAEAGSSHEKEV